MDLCFVDTETTSLSAEHGEIWEFAGIRRSYEGSPLFNSPNGVWDGKDSNGPYVERRLEFQIECDLGTADPFSLSIGRYRERFGVKGEWEPYTIFSDEGPVGPDVFDTNPNGAVVTSKFDAAKLIERFTRGTTLIGNVISFDSERMERLLRAYNECPGWYYHVIDLEPYAVGFLKGKGVKDFTLPYKSSEITEALGVPQPKEGEGLHTALGDTLWVRDMWDAIQNWDDLEAWNRRQADG